MNQPAIVVSLGGLPDSTLVVHNLSELIGAVSLLLNQYSTPTLIPKVVYKRPGETASLSLTVVMHLFAPELNQTELQEKAKDEGLGYMKKLPDQAAEVFFAY